MEKPGIEPATPGLQGIALIHYTTGASRRTRNYFCGRVPWLYQYWPVGFMLFVVLCPGTPEGSTGSGSGFKASQKTGQRLKVSSDRELGIDDTFKRFLISMHILTIKYLKIYKYYDVILFSEKEKNTSILLKFLLFIICKYFINTSAFMTT